MKNAIKKLPKSQIEIAVTAEPDELKPYLAKAAEDISKDNPIDGFRPGKAPFDIVKGRFGEYAIYEKAAKIFIEKKYLDIIHSASGESKNPEFEKNGSGFDKNESSEFVGRPDISITKIAPGEALEFKIRLSVMPEFTLPDYKKTAKALLKERKTPEVSETEVADTLNYIRESRAKFITVSRPAETGDAAEISYETFDGFIKLEGLESQNHPLTIGDNKFIQGFEEHLIGMKAGDKKEFRLKLPENFPDKNLAGREVSFRVAMNLVQKREIPDLNDDLARSLGNFSGKAALETNIKEGILMEKEKKEKDRIRIKIVEKIADGIKTELPQVLIDAELEKMLGELKSGIENMGLNFNDYLLNIKKTEKELKSGWEKDAEKRVKIALVLRKIGSRESINPSEGEIQEAAERYLEHSGLTEKEIRQIDKDDLRDYAKGVVRNEKVFEFLEKI